MSDTAPRASTAASQRMADALLRSVGGTTALLRVTLSSTDTNQWELGLVATSFADAVVSPVVLRKVRPSWNEGGEQKWELLISASSVAQQVDSLSLSSARSLFALTMMVTVAGQDYLIESISSSEAFGNVYLYRLLLREARTQAV